MNGRASAPSKWRRPTRSSTPTTTCCSPRRPPPAKPRRRSSPSSPSSGRIRPARWGRSTSGRSKRLSTTSSPASPTCARRRDIPVWHWHGDVAAYRKARLMKNPRASFRSRPNPREALLMRKHSAIARLFCDLRYIVIDEVHFASARDRGGQTLCLIERPPPRQRQSPPHRAVRHHRRPAAHRRLPGGEKLPRNVHPADRGAGTALEAVDGAFLRHRAASRRRYRCPASGRDVRRGAGRKATCSDRSSF